MEKWDTSQKLSTLLKNYLRESGTARVMLERRTTSVWAQVVGPTVVRATRSLRVHNGILFVGLDSSLVREQLTYIADQLRLALNEAVGGEAIQEIKFL